MTPMHDTDDKSASQSSNATSWHPNQSELVYEATCASRRSPVAVCLVWSLSVTQTPNTEPSRLRSLEAHLEAGACAEILCIAHASWGNYWLWLSDAVAGLLLDAVAGSRVLASRCNVNPDSSFPKGFVNVLQEMFRRHRYAHIHGFHMGHSCFVRSCGRQ